jgi:hypothetical protein
MQICYKIYNLPRTSIRLDQHLPTHPKVDISTSIENVRYQLHAWKIIVRIRSWS